MNVPVSAEPVRFPLGDLFAADVRRAEMLGGTPRASRTRSSRRRAVLLAAAG
jgi:hypothetical protein